MTASLQEAHRRICDVEQERDLLRPTVDGWAAWPLLRFETSLLLTGIGFSPAPQPGRAARAIQALTELPSLASVRRARHLVKTYTSGLIEHDGDRYRDIWFDDILEAAGSVVKIESGNSRAFEPRRRHAMIPADIEGGAVDLTASLLARRAPSSELTHASRTLAAALRGAFGLSSIDDEWVSRRLRAFSAARRVYARIVRRVRPAFVLVADFGEHALVAAAKAHGAIVLELQHGVTDASNAGYGWTDYAGPFRSVMPVPDRLLLYGEYWRQELDRSTFWRDALRVVGSPRLDRYRRRQSEAAGEATVLFTTQGIERERVAAFLAAFLTQVEQRGRRIRLIVKLHPIHDADKTPYERALSAHAQQVELLAADEGLSTFELMTHARLHVSIASASHYDAIGLGVPTVILPFTTSEVVAHLERSGHARIAGQPSQLADLALSSENLTVPEDVREYYFRSGALANILRELDIEPRKGLRAS